MKNSLKLFILIGILNSTSLQTLATKKTNLHSFIIEAAGGTSTYIPFAGSSYKASLGLHTNISQFISIITSLEYNNFCLNSSAEGSKFQTASTGIGARFYFSQFFWPSPQPQGIFIEALGGFGFAYEKVGYDPDNLDSKKINIGTVYTLSSGLGYNYAFSFGLALGGSMRFNARGFTDPINQKTFLLAPIPEILVHIGWLL